MLDVANNFGQNRIRQFAFSSEGVTYMGGLQPIDILILALVSTVAVLIIFLRIRSRNRAKSEAGKCSGGCGSCSMSCHSDLYTKDSKKI